MSAQESRDDGRGKLYKRNLDFTLKELQNQVREHEEQLEKLRAETKPRPEIIGSPAATMGTMKQAFDELAQSDPFLPFPDSRELDKSRADLEDQEALEAALEKRLETLRSEDVHGTTVAPEDIARQRLEELRKEKQYYSKETTRLFKAYKTFVEDKLAPLLAAEELGGPVAQKVKPAQNEDKRQRRLDELWGTGGEQQRQAGSGEWDEKVAAGMEMKRLTEDLLNQLVDAKGNAAASYVILEKESSAARFLVRAKVAQFHPKDATRLRLIDFGKEIDD
ncbi:unnamed protein product [Parascedosporium putredinis]|uniref:Uncharacterized protein n=1 Tax=Parascedosporium putredinis TaxID=1442378 RepID=A0A9P1H660_9PEZI|nr:unnamed protein product [Parascedosporium putredinis]CAI7998550.1 unnamed protein product [Parascedosporium putredinis]